MAEKRMSYAHVYLCVRADTGEVLTDSKDGLVLAWTDWKTAEQFAGRTGMMVINWQGFLSRYLDRLSPRPTAARVFVATKKRGVLKYHAELDATAEEIGTLNTFCEWEIKRRPRVEGEKLRKAKIWLEGAE